MSQFNKTSRRPSLDQAHLPRAHSPLRPTNKEVAMATITYVTHDGEDYPAPVTPGKVKVWVLRGVPG